ncbi:MAG: HAMP domain-containing sensor histidine kinase, partial [Sulfurimonadaceae bacterium]|nr:HAMP domain-containing sensor histidine kinase [Sulfurimonadaceae bacterium]
VRTQGLIIAQKGIEPLTQSIGDDITKYLPSKDTGSAVVGEDLVAYASIPITTGSALYGFGGSYASIDHIKGNRGEAWHIVISYKLEEALSVARETTNLLLAATVIFILITIATALYIGKWVAKPVEKLSELAKKFGSGDLTERAEVLSKDEVGTLASTLNTMAENLQVSNVKRDELMAKIQENNVALTAANDKLKELDLLKTMFIASMSHELRTPLNAIIGFSSILQQGMLGELNEQQQDKISRIHTSGQRLLDLIVDVIDISKIEAGEIELKPDTFAIGELFDEAVATVQNAAGEKGIAIECDSTPDTTITCDRERLMQAVQNYLSNAVKFSEAGTVTLRSKVRGNDLHIEVIDTGIGIDEGDIPKLFKAFERIDSPLSVKAGGAGIGLYLTKKIVEELLGGSVYVYSQKNTGSTFGITLPLISKQES